MERRRQIYLQRSVVKDQAVQDLLAGRLTLLQAAAQFRDVEKEQPVTWLPPNAATGPAEGEACAGWSSTGRRLGGKELTLAGGRRDRTPGGGTRAASGSGRHVRLPD